MLFRSISLHTLMSTVDDSIHPPTLSYEDYRRNLEASQVTKAQSGTDTTLQIKEQQEKQAKENVDYERKLKPHLDAILANLAKYAATIQAAKPSEEGVDNFVRENMRNIHDDWSDVLTWKYVDGLEKATADLAADGERLAKFPVDDPRRVRWDEFLTSYTNEFKKLITDDSIRIQTDHKQAAVDKAQALLILYAAGAVFFIFVIATILLVLLRIERNTRSA